MSVFDGARYTFGLQGPPGAATVEQVGDLETRLAAREAITIPTTLNDMTDVSGTPATGDLLQYTGSGWAPYTPGTTTVGTALEIILDGGGVALTAGYKRLLRVPATMNIREATIDCDRSGSITVDIWRIASGGTYPPTSANSITGGKKLVVTSTTRAGVTVADVDTYWTDDLAYGDYLMVNVDSAATVQWALVTLFTDREV